RAVASPDSPASIRPFGRAQRPGFFPAGRMAAITQRPPRRRTSTPPAENSRCIPEDLIRADSDHRVYTCAAGTQVTRVPTTSTSLAQGGGSQMNLQPLGDRLIVEGLEEEETTASGIVLPDTAKEKPQRGRVLAVGPGPRDEDGEHIAMDV